MLRRGIIRRSLITSQARVVTVDNREDIRDLLAVMEASRVDREDMDSRAVSMEGTKADIKDHQEDM